MHGLLEKYGSDMDFIGLNIDDPASLPARERYDLVQRSQYILLDGQGNVVKKWFGYLDAADVSAEIDRLLDT